MSRGVFVPVNKPWQDVNGSVLEVGQGVVAGSQ